MRQIIEIDVRVDAFAWNAWEISQAVQRPVIYETLSSMSLITNVPRLNLSIAGPPWSWLGLELSHRAKMLGLDGRTRHAPWRSLGCCGMASRKSRDAITLHFLLYIYSSPFFFFRSLSQNGPSLITLVAPIPPAVSIAGTRANSPRAGPTQ